MPYNNPEIKIPDFFLFEIKINFLDQNTFGLNANKIKFNNHGICSHYRN